MGLALDESTEQDLFYEKDGIKFLLSPDTAELIKHYGLLTLDYVETFYRKGFKLSLKNVSCC
ncbi:MAG: hypothetical protein ABRQ38_17070 [Candidatus Eremiobacterota bacterium]